MPRKQSVGAVDSIIGREVRRLRIERGLTQRQLATRVACNPVVISDVEQGLRDAHSLLPRLAEFFGVDVSAITSLATPCAQCSGSGIVERASRSSALRRALTQRRIA